MRLLLDQNLAPALVHMLADIFPDSAHVRTLGLERAPDEELWEFAAANGFAVVSKDSDFHQRSFL